MTRSIVVAASQHLGGSLVPEALRFGTATLKTAIRATGGQHPNQATTELKRTSKGEILLIEEIQVAQHIWEYLRLDRQIYMEYIFLYEN